MEYKGVFFLIKRHTLNELKLKCIYFSNLLYINYKLI